MLDILPEPEPAESGHAYRIKAWIALACGLAAFWIFAAGLLALILAGGGR